MFSQCKCILKKEKNQCQMMKTKKKQEKKKNNGNPCFSTNQMFKKQTYKRIKKLIVRKKRLELGRVNPSILWVKLWDRDNYIKRETKNATKSILFFFIKKMNVKLWDSKGSTKQIDGNPWSEAPDMKKS